MFKSLAFLVVLLAAPAAFAQPGNCTAQITATGQDDGITFNNAFARCLFVSPADGTYNILTAIQGPDNGGIRGPQRTMLNRATDGAPQSGVLIFGANGLGGTGVIMAGENFLVKGVSVFDFGGSVGQHACVDATSHSGLTVRDADIEGCAIGVNLTSDGNLNPSGRGNLVQNWRIMDSNISGNGTGIQCRSINSGTGCDDWVVSNTEIAANGSGGGFHVNSAFHGLITGVDFEDQYRSLWIEGGGQITVGGATTFADANEGLFVNGSDQLTVVGVNFGSACCISSGNQPSWDIVFEGTNTNVTLGPNTFSGFPVAGSSRYIIGTAGTTVSGKIYDVCSTSAPTFYDATAQTTLLPLFVGTPANCGP